jgi:predicted nucleotidyltransferase
MQRAVVTDWDITAQRLEAVRATAGELAQAARAYFGRRLRAIRLFGSAARGDGQEGSDVDVLILLDEAGSADREWIAERATRLGVLGAGVVLSAVTLAESDFERLRQRERLFPLEIEREGIPL